MWIEQKELARAASIQGYMEILTDGLQPDCGHRGAQDISPVFALTAGLAASDGGCLDPPFLRPDSAG